MFPNRLFKLRRHLRDNAESDSIPTLFREVSDVGLGYTPMRQRPARVSRGMLNRGFLLAPLRKDRDATSLRNARLLCAESGLLC
jgi:hypothetical protein